MTPATAAAAFDTTLMSAPADAATQGLGARLVSLIALLAQPAASPLDAREAYLAKAVDHADLERRSQAWDAHMARMRSITFAG